MAYRLREVEPFLKFEEPYRCPTCPYCNGTKDATVKHPEKLSAWAFWEAIGKPKHVVAPMVDQSELPFRMFCRKYGADLAYTPMYHSRLFATDPTYRKQMFSTVPEDRPLFVQFCGHDAETVLAAARHVEDQCDAVDINLGCPQGIARKGQYGSFLMEHWDIVHTIIHTLHVELKVPVTAKIRRFDSVDLTLRYARMVRDAGAQIIGVHGRTREQKGQITGMADMSFVKAVKDEIKEVPIISNGNILTFPDIAGTLAETGADAAMSAESLLWDPKLFSNPPHPALTGRFFQADRAVRRASTQTAAEYVEFLKKYPVHPAFAKTHLFKILHHTFEKHHDALNIRQELARVDARNDGDLAAAIATFDRVVAMAIKAEAECEDEGPYVKREKIKKAKGELKEDDDAPSAPAATSSDAPAATATTTTTSAETAVGPSGAEKKRARSPTAEAAQAAEAAKGGDGEDDAMRPEVACEDGSCLTGGTYS